MPDCVKFSVCTFAGLINPGPERIFVPRRTKDERGDGVGGEAYFHERYVSDTGVGLKATQCRLFSAPVPQTVSS